MQFSSLEDEAADEFPNPRVVRNWVQVVVSCFPRSTKERMAANGLTVARPGARREALEGKGRYDLEVKCHIGRIFISTPPDLATG